MHDKRRAPAQNVVRIVIFSLCCLNAAPEIFAQTGEAPGRISTLVAYTENDDWWPDTGTDKNYTNALRVTIERNYDMWRLRRLGRLFRWIPEHINCADVRPIADPFLKCVSTSWHVIGQQFYTPDDITVSELIPDDRPYAGWLYVGGSWKSTTYSSLVESDMYVGLTGEGSLAKPVQTFWHKLVGASEPRGWSNQIGGRFGVVVGHSRRKAFEGLTTGGLRWLEFVPYVGATAGNIVTDGYGGGRFRIGYNLSRDWNQIGIAPRVVVRGDRKGRMVPPTLELYVVVDGQGRGLAYNAFIDAAPNHVLDRKYFVADGGVGIGFRFKRFSASYRVAFVSPEYDEALVHDYKALRFSYAFR
jgi:lipid A 3-O-deacylase